MGTIALWQAAGRPHPAGIVGSASSDRGRRGGAPVALAGSLDGGVKLGFDLGIRGIGEFRHG